MMLALALVAQAQPANEVQYLSGHGPEDAVKWDFWCSEGMQSGKWGKIAVPSCWEQQGFGGLTYGRYYIYDRESDKKWADRHDNRLTTEYGLYRHRFQVPRAWEGRQVSIVFEGAMTDTEVKVNGQLAGAVHQGGFYRFSYDISDKLLYGKKNLLEVKVDKQSADKSVNAAERRADWWLFGGIYRPVYLVAKPQTHIGHVAIDARADGKMRLDLRCKNLKGDEQLELTIQRKGDRLAAGRRLIPLKAAGHYKFAKKYGMEYYNYGRNGNCIALDLKQWGTGMYKRYKEMRADLDYVVVIAGHNDASGNRIDSIGIDTFKERLRILCEGLIEKYPDARLFFFTPWSCKDFVGSTRQQVVDAMLEVCGSYGIPVFDAARRSNIFATSEQFRKKYFQGGKGTDTAHLNARGHDRFLLVAESFILQYVEQ